MASETTTTRAAESPELYRAKGEAPAYLKMPSTRAFHEKRKKIEKEHGVKIRGVRLGREWVFHRDQLDAMGRLMCNVGEDD